MSYWCYFLQNNVEQVLQNIIKHRTITFPKCKNHAENDIIIIYRIGKHSGFWGYVRTETTAYTNNEQHKYIIFNDEAMNMYYSKIKTIHVFKQISVVNKKKNIIGNTETFVREFDNQLVKHQIILQLSNELGEHLRTRILLKLRSPIVDADIEQKVTPKCKEVNEVKEVIVKSEYIIPILVVPCKKLAKIKDINDDTFLMHIKECRKCDMTNNNERITLDMLIGKQIKLRIFNNCEDIKALVEMYHSLEICKTNNIKVVYIDRQNDGSDEHEMIEEKSDDDAEIDVCKVYNHCYFIVGRMDKEY